MLLAMSVMSVCQSPHKDRNTNVCLHLFSSISSVFVNLICILISQSFVRDVHVSGYAHMLILATS